MSKCYPGKYSRILADRIMGYLRFQSDQELEYAKPEQIELIKRVMSTLRQIADQCRDIDPVIFAIARMKRKGKILRINKATGERRYIKILEKEIFHPGDSGRITLSDKGKIAWTKDEIIQENNHEYLYKP